MSVNPKIKLKFRLPNQSRDFSFDYVEGQPSKMAAVSPAIEQERGGKNNQNLSVNSLSLSRRAIVGFDSSSLLRVVLMGFTVIAVVVLETQLAAMYVFAWVLPLR